MFFLDNKTDQHTKTIIQCTEIIINKNDIIKPLSLTESEIEAKIKEDIDESNIIIKNENINFSQYCHLDSDCDDQLIVNNFSHSNRNGDSNIIKDTTEAESDDQALVTLKTKHKPELNTTNKRKRNKTIKVRCSDTNCYKNVALGNIETESSDDQTIQTFKTNKKIKSNIDNKRKILKKDKVEEELSDIQALDTNHKTATNRQNKSKSKIIKKCNDSNKNDNKNTTKNEMDAELLNIETLETNYKTKLNKNNKSKEIILKECNDNKNIIKDKIEEELLHIKALQTFKTNHKVQINSSNKRKKVKNTKQTFLCNKNELKVDTDRFESKEKLADFERMFNVDILVLSKDEQIKDVLDRRTGVNYLHSPYRCEMCFKGFMDQDCLHKHHMAQHDVVSILS